MNLLGDAIKIMESRLDKDRGKTARISEIGSCALILTLTEVKDAATDNSVEEIIKRLDTTPSGTLAPVYAAFTSMKMRSI